LGAVANRIDFLNSHSIHCCCIERLLVFVNWYFILPLCWQCLWCLGVFFGGVLQVF
jgi:hypothetical protein